MITFLAYSSALLICLFTLWVMGVEFPRFLGCIHRWEWSGPFSFGYDLYQNRTCQKCQLVRQRRIGWAANEETELEPPVRELLCQRCEQEYPVWFAPNELWNRVCHDGRDIHFLCLTCFAILAEEKGIVPTAWVVSMEEV